MIELTIQIDDAAAESISQIGANQRMSAEQTAAYLLDRTLFGVTRLMATSGEDYKPQSVMVMIDDTADDILKHFRCTNCGNIVFDYCGETKLIMHGRYDRESMMIDGEQVESDSFGRPTRIECPGRVMIQYPNGRQAKVRCGNKFYKLKA